MSKYTNIDDLDARIERVVKRKVKHYYTDWKNYDRPTYMKYKGSNKKEDKELILIVRKCGTYLFTVSQIKEYKFANVVFDYYLDTEDADYYLINLNNLFILKKNYRDIKERKKFECS